MPDSYTGRPIQLVVAPYDSGRRAWRMGAGPLAIIEHGLPEFLRESGHDVLIDYADAPEADPLESLVSLGNTIAESVRVAHRAGRFPVVLSGNCTATIAAVAGLASSGSGTVWMDAHGDLNTPATSPSGFLDGMAAAMLLGWCHTDELARIPGWSPLAPSHFLSIGARAFDPDEKEHAERAGVSFLAPESALLEEDLTRALARLAQNVSTVYLHFDLDVLDPDEHGPANVYAEPGGLKYYEALRVIQEVAIRLPISGVTISAYDPAVDATGVVGALPGPLIYEAIHCNAEVAADTLRRPDGRFQGDVQR